MAPTNLFSLFIGLGVGVGLYWSIKPNSQSPKISRERMNIALTSLIAAVVGGRIGYILLNSTYFQGHLIETVQIWLGGFSWLGSLIGTTLAILIVTKVKGISLLETTDNLIPLFTSTAIFFWIACWITGYAYGVEIDTWWGVPAADEWGDVSHRWPTQLFGISSILSMQFLIEYFQNRNWVKKPGAATGLILAGTAIIALCISHFRADPVPNWMGINLDVWFSIFIITLAALITLYIAFQQLATRFTDTNAGKNEN
jgi:prolipoprotein diacylglyceryltransferase